MLIGQVEKLELFHWFVRAHLENTGGELATSQATDETEAAVAAAETEPANTA
jgi:starvation-inducible DNA-binding protein